MGEYHPSSRLIGLITTLFIGQTGLLQSCRIVVGFIIIIVLLVLHILTLVLMVICFSLYVAVACIQHATVRATLELKQARLRTFAVKGIALECIHVFFVTVHISR